jgi:hypothetical protein
MYILGRTIHLQNLTFANQVKLVRWEIETAFDIITELAIFSASIYLVQGLQLSLSKKGTVILAFGFRLA